MKRKSKFNKSREDVSTERGSDIPKQETVKKNKERKGYRKPIENTPYSKGPNDIKWRTNDETMTRLVASLPFGKAAGLPITHNQGNGLGILSFVQPGVLAIRTLVTAGSATSYNSPINLVSRKIYSYVRHANSGSKNYDAVDMTNYFIAIGQVLAYLGFLQRVLRLMHEYSATNRYTPKALLRMMSVDADALLPDIAKLKYAISWLGKAIGSLAFPDLPYFRACYEAFQYVFRDNDSPKEQYYLLTPDSIGKYIPQYDSNGGGVMYHDASGVGTYITNNIIGYQNPTYMDFQYLFDLARERMDVLMGDEDCGIISGDILKAFKDAGLYKPVALPLDYEVIQHSPEMLQQIHNACCFDTSRLQFTGYKQNPGSISTAPFLEHDILVTGQAFTSGAELTSGLVIDAFSREPDPAEVVNCTVLNPQMKLKLASNGTDYVYDASTLLFDFFLPQTALITSDIQGQTYVDITGLMRRCGNVFSTSSLSWNDFCLTNFDWHPMFWIGKSSNLYVVGDIQNLAIFDYDTARRIHENSSLNLFDFKEHNFY